MRLKILSVVEALCLGGAQTVLTDVALSLKEHEHLVVHFSRANDIVADRSLCSRLNDGGIRCLDVHWESLRNPEQRSKILADFSPDVVFCHWWGADPWMPWVLARSPHRPAFVCVMHHHDIQGLGGYDRYVLVSATQRSQVDFIEPRRVALIPNGVDLSRFPPRSTADETASGRRFVIGRLSEMREGKISSDWVRTLSAYRLERCKFVIAGNGTLLNELRASATEWMSEDEISFPGHISREDVPGLLRNFDVFCYTTSSAVECCPLVILEAMAAGLPIVAEARGGMPEIVVHHENGLLAHSLDEVGQHLRLLRDNPILRARLGRGARATAERFSLDRQTQAYRQLLAEISLERAVDSHRLR